MRPESRFAIPGGCPVEVLNALDNSALGGARARVAARLGNPDPFDLRSWLGTTAHVDPLPPTTGLPLSPDAADAVLVAAALANGANAQTSGLVGLFAGRPPGPAVRSVPVDNAAAGWLRFPRGNPPPPHRWGRLESWSTADIGDEPIATVRCAVPIPGGIALGSDYGLTLWQAGKFTAFPWPAGARREARRVEAMTVHRGELVIATSQSLVTWNFRGEPTIRKHRADQEGGWDEIRALVSMPDRLGIAWRTGFEGGEGPPEVFAACTAPGAVYLGANNGMLHVLDGGPLRALSEGGRHAVRHLAYADGSLHAAAGGKHHRFDGASWTATAPEPTGFSVDRMGRLWMIAEGRIFGHARTGPIAVPVAVERPWCLAAAGGRLWIGGKERVWSLGIE